jgi:hypothetical protein
LADSGLRDFVDSRDIFLFEWKREYFFILDGDVNGDGVAE